MIPHIDISVQAGPWPPEERLRTIVERAVSAAIQTGGLRFAADSELSILCTDDAAMRRINAQWRGADKPTNVLSFPGVEIGPGEVAGPVIGDIVLAFETIAREAELEAKSFEHHLLHMIVHGFLHLFGYDHIDDADARVMEDLERKALESLGVDDPYAA